ncbi:MAG: hypothetical protein ACR2RF_11470, partial [Geminicoccaceae bacterium]
SLPQHQKPTHGMDRLIGGSANAATLKSDCPMFTLRSARSAKGKCGQLHDPRHLRRPDQLKTLGERP